MTPHALSTHTAAARAAHIAVTGLMALGAAAALMAPSRAQAQAAAAADLEAGKARAQAVCAACHGANGVSVADTIPNLAGQRVAYLEGQLKALKDGTRKAPVMNAMAAQLNPGDITNVAAYFSSLPPGGGTAKSEMLPNLKTNVRFPEGYQGSFVKYHTINFPATKQVRYYFANPVAMQAAKEGRTMPDGAYFLAEVYSAKLDADKKPITGADGFFQPDQLVGYTAMQRDKGFGDAIPEMLRNDQWNYAAFTTAKAPRPVNHAECLACHKPLDKVSYLFTLDQVTAAAKSKY
jgi:cytochrome c553